KHGTFAPTASTPTSPASTTCYLDDGPTTHTVKGRINDKDGGYTDYTTGIDVTNVAPTATFGNTGPVNEHSTATVSFGSQLDPSTADTLAGFKYSYDFNNDGTFRSAERRVGKEGRTGSAPDHR